MRAIHQPTLIVWGRQDRLVPPDHAGIVEAKLPQSRAILFDKCGHLPQLEQPGQFNAAVLDFLSGPARLEIARGSIVANRSVRVLDKMMRHALYQVTNLRLSRKRHFVLCPKGRHRLASAPTAAMCQKQRQ